MNSKIVHFAPFGQHGDTFLALHEDGTFSVVHVARRYNPTTASDDYATKPQPVRFA